MIKSVPYSCILETYTSLCLKHPLMFQTGPLKQKHLLSIFVSFILFSLRFGSLLKISFSLWKFKELLYDNALSCSFLSYTNKVKLIRTSLETDYQYHLSII